MHDSCLKTWRPLIKDAVRILSPDYDYLSVLASDTAGKMYQVRSRSSELRDFMCERGIVARAISDGIVAEVSMNDLPTTGKLLAEKLGVLLDEQFAWIKENNVEPFKVHLSDETNIEDFIIAADRPFASVSIQDKLARLRKLVVDVSAGDPRVLNAVAVLGEVTVNKLFVSKHKDLYQSYPWSQGYLMAIAKGDKGVKMGFTSISGQKGAEILDELETKTELLIKQVGDMLNAKAMVPGEYDVICTPEVTGLIAHEAFGHGVEMDMFVKERALAKSFIDKAVASEKVIMHEGALGPKDVSSYAFDDEGTLAGDTIEIDRGILRTGVADALAASRLGIAPTGNGKRESFERKAYTRMTNTYFEKGTDTVDEMIASIKFGYLLDGMESGMEDPKNWGIQCVLSRAYEIQDGKLNGNVFGPVILTGQVVDLLKSIDGVSGDFDMFGAGFCGKGHKEYVKTACGGPYIKAKARLG
ncbi:MAG: TldD/PmbA family protein [Erysipelotrichaceae bacterium]